MAGNQSRGLVQASKTKGWDPTKVEGADLSNWDKDTGNAPIAAPGDGLGRIPGGLPAVSGTRDATEAPQLAERVTFAVPDAGRETAKRATTNANPFPAMPGAGG